MFLSGATAQREAEQPQARGVCMTQLHTTISRTPLNEGSARRKGLFSIHIV